MYGPIYPVHPANHFGYAFIHPINTIDIATGAKRVHLQSPYHHLPRGVAHKMHQGAHLHTFKPQRSQQEKIQLFATELLEKQLQYSTEIQTLISQESLSARKRLAAIEEELQLVIRQVEEIDAYFAEHITPASQQTAETLSLLIEITRENQAVINANNAQELAKTLIEEALKQQHRLYNLPLTPAYKQIAEEINHELAAMQEQAEEIRQAAAHVPVILQQLLQDTLACNASRIQELKQLMTQPQLMAAPKLHAAIDRKLSILNDQPLDVIAPDIGFLHHSVLTDFGPVRNPDAEEPLFLSIWASYIEQDDVQDDEKAPTEAEKLAKMLAELRREALYRKRFPSDSTVNTASEADSDGDSFMGDSFLNSAEDSIMEDSFHLDNHEDNAFETLNGDEIDADLMNQYPQERFVDQARKQRPASIARAAIHAAIDHIALRVVEIIQANESDALAQLEVLEGEMALQRANWELLHTKPAVRLPSALSRTIFTTLQAIEEFRKRQNASLSSTDSSNNEPSMEDLKRRLEKLLEISNLDLDGDISMGDSLLDDLDADKFLVDPLDKQQLLSNPHTRRLSGQRLYIRKEDAARQKIHQQIDKLAMQAAKILLADEADAMQQLDMVAEDITRLRAEWELLQPKHAVRLPSALFDTIYTTLGWIEDYRNRKNHAPVAPLESSDRILTAEEELAKMMDMFAAGTGADDEEQDESLDIAPSEERF